MATNMKIEDQQNEDRYEENLSSCDENSCSSSSLASNDDNINSLYSNRGLSNRRKQLKPNRMISVQGKLRIETTEQDKPVDTVVDNKRCIDDNSVNTEKRKQQRMDETACTNGQKSHLATVVDTIETAYCTICKKEFCNKYFLKSHMSNKHGGMFEPTSTVYLGTQGSMMTHFKYMSSTSTTTKAKSQSDTNVAVTTTRPSSSNDVSQTTTSMRLVKADHSLSSSALSTSSSSDCDGMTTTTMALATEDEQQTTKNDNSTDQLSITEDYCDLCQKHFCNKYYLRKHKLDVHGILIDNNIKTYKKHDKATRRQHESTINNEVKKTSNNTTCHDGPDMDQFQMISKSADSVGKQRSSTPQATAAVACTMNDASTSLNSHTKIVTTSPPPSPIPTMPMQSHPLDFTIPSNLPGYMLLNPYIMQFPHFFAAKHAAAVVAAAAAGLNPSLSLPHSQLLSQHELATLQTQNPNIQMDQTAAAAVDAAQASNDTNDSNQLKQIVDNNSPQQAVNKNRSKSLSASNVDYVNCSMCSKSFCNVEYLRLHLINKHGISNPKSQIAELTTTSDHQSASTATSHRYELKLKDSNTFCFICEQEFQTKMAIKAHILQKHGDNTDSKQEHQNKHATSTNATATESDLNNSSQNGKCLDKVVCTICSKQLCNKYFLKTHKLKVHGVQDDSLLFDQTGQASDQMAAIKEQQILDVRDYENEKENNDEQLFTDPTKDTKILKAYCQICNKELCNKYFLRSHMLNAHNISMDVGGFGETTNDINECKSKKPKTLASKKVNTKTVNKEVGMQAFLVESKDKQFSENFVSCLIYLPTKTKIEQTLSLQLQLKPFDENVNQPYQHESSLDSTAGLDMSLNQIDTTNGSGRSTPNGKLEIDVSDDI